MNEADFLIPSLDSITSDDDNDTLYGIYTNTTESTSGVMFLFIYNKMV